MDSWLNMRTATSGRATLSAASLALRVASAARYADSGLDLVSAESFRDKLANTGVAGAALNPHSVPRGLLAARAERTAAEAVRAVVGEACTFLSVTLPLGLAGAHCTSLEMNPGVGGAARNPLSVAFVL